MKKKFGFWNIMDFDEWQPDEFSSEDSEEVRKRADRPAPTEAELEAARFAKEERRRKHFQASRKRNKANKKARNVKRDFTWKHETIDDIEFFKPVVCLDLIFCEQLREKEVTSVANQVQHCYGLNRKMAKKKPLELHLLGVALPSLAPVFERHEGFESWKVFRHASSNLKELFDPTRIVYLSPESPNILQVIDEESVYVIGGISDNQNELKGTTLLYAADNGYRHARLPLMENCPGLTTRGTVLNINHCFQIILLMAQGDITWAEAIDIAVPTRESFRTQ